MELAKNLKQIITTVDVERTEPLLYSFGTIGTTQATPVPLPFDPYSLPLAEKDANGLINMEFLKERTREFVGKHLDVLVNPEVVIMAKFNWPENAIDLQLCELVEDTQGAIFKAISRGVSELYVDKDVVGTVRLDIPSPQRAGTYMQQSTYASQAAMRVYNQMIEKYGEG